MMQLPPAVTGRLVLTPQAAWAAPDDSSVYSALHTLQLLDAPLPPVATPAAFPRSAFTLSDQFFTLFAFTGCAVQLPTTAIAIDSAPACYLQFIGPLATPYFFAGANTRPPRCPNCGKAATNWRAQTAAWSADDAPYPLCCPHCRTCQPGWAWQWRQHAGFGRVAVSIEGVFPGEVTPLPPVLTALAQATALPWQWLHVQG